MSSDELIKKPLTKSQVNKGYRVLLCPKCNEPIVGKHLVEVIICLACGYAKNALSKEQVITEDNIFDKSPEVSSLGGKWAFVSQHCTWWTTFPDDLKSPPPPFNMPVCPYCRSTLTQSPLEDFMEHNIRNRDKDGMKRLLLAHDKNATRCYGGFSKISLEQ